MKDFVLLPVGVGENKQGLVAGHTYYYKVPTFFYGPDGSTVLLMTAQKGRELFLADPNNWQKLKLLPDRPDECASWVEIDDLIIPLPDSLPSKASVLRVNHILNADGSFEILAELQNATSADMASAEIVGLNGTGWTQPGLFIMTVKPQSFGGLSYTFSKSFTGLKTGDSIQYNVHANQDLEFLSGTIQVANTDPTKGPVWGIVWKPKKITLGSGYTDTLAADAATGTGTVSYTLISGPAWYIFAQNTRNIAGNPTPTIAPAVAEKVTYRAFDSVGATDKTFTLEYSSVLEMVVGWGYSYQNSGYLYIGMGPDDDAPFKLKLTALSSTTPVWTQTAQITALHQTIGIAEIAYPWQQTYLNVPIGVYLLEVLRANGQLRYGLIQFDGTAGQHTLVMSEIKPTYTAPVGHATGIGELYEAYQTSASVTSRRIDVGAVTEGGAQQQAVLKEILTGGGERSYGGTDAVFSKDPSDTTPMVVTADGKISLPLNTISANATGKILVTAGGYTTPGTVSLINVAPTGAAPVRQTKRDDIEVTTAGDVTFAAPAPWFNPAGVLSAQQYLPGSLTLTNLDNSILIFNTSTGLITVKGAHPNAVYVIHQVCTNDYGTAIDNIKLTVNRTITAPVTVTGLRATIAPVTENNVEITPTLTELLSNGSERTYVPGPPPAWTTAPGTPAAVLFNPSTGGVTVPIDSISSNFSFTLNVTVNGLSTSVVVPVTNLDPTNVAPARINKRANITVTAAGAQAFAAPNPWFSPVGTLDALKWNGTTGSPLDSSIITFNKTTGEIIVSASHPNGTYTIRQVCYNPFGQGIDDITLTVARVGSEGKITGIWRGFNGNQLNYYVHGNLLTSTDKWRVEYRQTPGGSYEGVVSTDWAPYRLICSPGTATTGTGDWYRNYGANGQGIQTHLEFRVINIETNAVVGPTLSFDFTIPFPDAVILPAQVYSAP